MQRLLVSNKMRKFLSQFVMILVISHGANQTLIPMTTGPETSGDPQGLVLCHVKVHVIQCIIIY
jgi:hypothetical protein